MFRVLVIAVLAFIALVVVHQGTPIPDPDVGDDPSSFEVREGIWEGTLDSFRLDGSPIGGIRVQKIHRKASGNEQEITIRDKHDDDSVVESSARMIRHDGDLELRVDGPDGVTRFFRGRTRDDELHWYRQDAASGVTESYRERIDGDDLWVDGVGVYGDDVVVFEGRFHRTGR